MDNTLSKSLPQFAHKFISKRKMSNKVAITNPCIKKNYFKVIFDAKLHKILKAHLPNVRHYTMYFNFNLIIHIIIIITLQKKEREELCLQKTLVIFLT